MARSRSLDRRPDGWWSGLDDRAAMCGLTYHKARGEPARVPRAIEGGERGVMRAGGRRLERAPAQHLLLAVPFDRTPNAVDDQLARARIQAAAPFHDREFDGPARVRSRAPPATHAARQDARRVVIHEHGEAAGASRFRAKHTRHGVRG